MPTRISKRAATAREKFATFLLETLGPDLKESGRKETGKDVMRCGALIRDGRIDRTFGRWLKTTLVPDLRASGMNFTAADLARCARYIDPSKKRKKKG